MGWRKYLGLERRGQHRHQVAIEVEFFVWDEAAKKPITAKAAGRLVNISSSGACLQTNAIRIGYHHLALDNDPTGKVPLILEMPPTPEGIPWTLESQIIWYNKSRIQEFKYELGLKFLGISPTQREHLGSLIKSIKRPIGRNHFAGGE